MRKIRAGRAAAALAAALLLAASCDFEGISELKAEMREPELVEVRIPVTGLSMNKASTVILVGGSEQLGAAVSPANATNKALTWSSNKEAVATVSETGLVAGLAPGSATIIAAAADGGYTASCEVTVSAVSVPVEGLGLDAASAKLVLGTTRQLLATISPANATNQNVNWSSSDPGVASVSSTGLVAGLKVGGATITAISVDGGFSETCEVAVYIPVTGVSLSASSAVLAAGATRLLVATVAPATATDQSLSWESSDEAVATVSATGLVTGIDAGSATISATTADGGYVAGCAVTVYVAVTGLSLSETSATMAAGSTRALAATVSPANATTKTVTWASSDEAVATVSPAGLVTAVAMGTATITATSVQGALKATCEVTVPGIRLSAASVEVGRSATVQLAATVVPSGSAVTWTSSAPAAATVSATGLVTGVDWGRSTTITATSAEGYSATEAVKVMGVVSTLAGQTAAGSADGSGAAAGFNLLRQMAYTGGYLYVADMNNNKIRRVDISNGAVTTFAGSGAMGRADGTGTAATLYWPNGMATDSVFLYFTDVGTSLVRKIQISNALVTTIAGNGDDGLINATGLSASFNCPKGIIASGSNLYVADSNNHLIRQIEAATSKVTTFAGSGTNGIVDGIGAAARFEMPWGITSYGTDLYVLDWDFTNGAAIRRIAIGSVNVSSLAGSATERGYADGTGAAVRLTNPNYGVSDGTYLYFTDNYMVRRLTIASSEVVTLAGLANTDDSADGTGSAARFLYPSGIALVGNKLYVNDQYRIRVVQ